MLIKKCLHDSRKKIFTVRLCNWSSDKGRRIDNELNLQIQVSNRRRRRSMASL